MSKLIYCNFSSTKQADEAVASLKQDFPNQMMSFVIDNSFRYSKQNINDYAPQGIPKAVLNQLYDGQVPPTASSYTQSTNSSYENSQAENITSVKMSFTNDTPREILSKLNELGATNVKSHFS